MQTAVQRTTSESGKFWPDIPGRGNAEAVLVFGSNGTTVTFKDLLPVKRRSFTYQISRPAFGAMVPTRDRSANGYWEFSGPYGKDGLFFERYDEKSGIIGSDLVIEIKFKIHARNLPGKPAGLRLATLDLKWTHIQLRHMFGDVHLTMMCDGQGE